MSADVPGTRRLSYKFRIYPTEAQKEAIQANIDACRYIYNRLLRMRIDSYQATKPTLKVHVLAPGADPDSERPEWLRGEDGEWVYEEVPNPDYDPEVKPLTKFDCSKLVSTIKSQTVSEDGRFFLKEADSTALIYANNNLDAAYQAFFRRVKQGGKPGFPRFKSRRNPMRAYKTAGAVLSRRDGEGWEKLKSLSEAEGKWTHVYLPKVGFVRAKIPRKARRSINKGIAEGSFAEVNRQLAYKCAWRGTAFALVPATTATAQTCSACGHVEKAVADDLRPRWRCPECGTVHDRKGNGAQNVLEEGMRLLAEAKE